MPIRPWLAVPVRMVLALALASAAVVLTAPQASAVQCAYDTVSRSLAVSTTSTDASYLVIQANGPYLEVGGVFCALLAEVNTVTINASAKPNIEFYFYLDSPLGPGFTNEGNGSSEIEFMMDGLTDQTSMTIWGTPAADKVTLGWLFDPATGSSRGAINLNGFVDGATSDNDIILNTFPGHIRVVGEEGDDVLSGNGTGTFQSRPNFVPLLLHGDVGANQLTGGYGDDRIVFAEALTPEGADVLSGGAGGVDTVEAWNVGEPSSIRASISLDGVANDGSRCPGTECNGDSVAADFERVVGSGASEIITGNDAPQYLEGGDGGDLVQGLGGNDTLGCGTGTYEGGGGADTIQIPSERYTPVCGILRGGAGTDTVDFQYARDPISVTFDNLSNDGPVNFTMNVRNDIERVIGSPYADSLTGNGDRDTLFGMAGSDKLLGGGGDDTLIPGLGVDTAGGGPGVDRLSYATSTLAVIIQVASRLVTGEGDDSYTSVESFVGSPQGDTMNGAGSADRFNGGDGNDGLFGFGGDDTINGGPGDDTINGGNGVDTCSQGPGVGSVLGCEQ